MVVDVQLNPRHVTHNTTQCTWCTKAAACRAIYTFASHLASDRHFPQFWTAWEEFEGRHGNVATWREMTRVHRAVAASFATVHFNTANVEAAVPVATDAIAAADPMAALEAAQAAKAPISGFVSGGVHGGAAGASGAVAAPAAANPEEIDIGDDDEDD